MRKANDRSRRQILCDASANSKRREARAAASAAALAPMLARLRVWPNGAGWRRAALPCFAAAAFAAAGGFASGAAVWAPQTDLLALAGFATAAVVIPALGEEVVFRGLLYRPGGAGAIARALREAVPVVLFAAWHPAQLVLGAPWAIAAFADPLFLAGVAGLGFCLQRVVAVTGSLWPAVATHWFVVVLWKALFGGG